jgi:hypothetical protein
MNRAQRLARDAATAAEVRSYQRHPDVIALRIERVRSQVDWMCWSGIALGLAFTMTNVQGFASGGMAAWSMPWLAAWVLDPTVSLVLLAILRAEQVTARYQVPSGPWVRRAKWLTLGATYAMNTWASYVAGQLASIVLHSVPPLVVFVAAEAITEVRDKLTDAVAVAVRAVAEPVNGSADSVHEPETVRTPFAEYLAEARSAWSPDVEITPAWVRRTTGCSRGLSSRLARALAAEVAGGRP